MIRTIPTGLVLLIFLTISVMTWSKGITITIKIDGNDLAVPIEIADPHIVRQFNIWNGPGVETRGPNGVPHPPAYLDPNRAAGRFIDWPKGMATDRPARLRRYDVSFYIGGGEPETQVLGTYNFSYEFDPSTEQGYVFLPTRSENMAFISHGVEGNWFHSSNKWEGLIRPIINESIGAVDRIADQ